MEGYQVCDDNDVETPENLFLSGVERDRLDPMLDVCAAICKQLDVDDRVKFKSAAKSFVHTHGFLGAIPPYVSVAWDSCRLSQSSHLHPQHREKTTSLGNT